MTPENYKKVIERYFGGLNTRNLDVFDEIIAPDYINHSPAVPNPPPGPAGLKPILAGILAAFPDLHYEIQDMVIGDGKVAVRTILTGTHAGDFFGIPPTGKKVSVNQFQIEYIRDGQIVEHWRVTDQLTMFQQMGLVKLD